MFYSMYCASAESDEKYVLKRLIRMRILCQHTFASAERKFNTIIYSLDERYSFDPDLH